MIIFNIILFIATLFYIRMLVDCLKNDKDEATIFISLLAIFINIFFNLILMEEFYGIFG